MINEKEIAQKTVFTDVQIPPFVFDFYGMINDIKKNDGINSVYLNSAHNKLEIYIYYEKEDFELEDKITKSITDFEENYKFFPEVYIYPLDMIESKELTLPKTAMEIQ